jgi:4-amino-4-deoxy-L-arabinose transferase-like glycosyltransferase
MENILPSNRTDYRKSSRLIYSFTILLALLVLAALALYVVRFVTAVQPGVSHDDAEYLVLAESFATGRPYRLINFPQQPFETVWPPGYPLFILAPAWLVIGPNYDLLRATSLILAIVNIGLVYKLFRPLLSPPFLILVVALFAFNQAVVGAAGLTMSETAFFFFSLLSVILFSIWREKPGILNWQFLLLVFTLFAAVLVRYVGVILIVAAFIYLVGERKYVRAIVLTLSVLALLLPFGFFLYHLGSSAPRSDSAVYIITWLLANLNEQLRISLVNYWRTVPFVLVPVLGPKAVSYLGAMQLAWTVDLVHSVILLFIMVGVIKSLRRREFFAFYSVGYIFLLIMITPRENPKIFNELRYTIPIIPFLYFFLIQGLGLTVTRFSKYRPFRQPKTITHILGIMLLTILVLRNIQQARAEFPIVDLSVGATWVRDNSPENTVVITPDPVSRYLYLRRVTVPYPKDRDPAVFLSEIEAKDVNYLLVAPALRTRDRQPNLALSLDPYLTDVVLPLIAENPARFSLVFYDKRFNTSVYQVQQKP